MTSTKGTRLKGYAILFVVLGAFGVMVFDFIANPQPAYVPASITATTVTTAHHSSCNRYTGDCYDAGADYTPPDAPAGDSHGWDY